MKKYLMLAPLAVLTAGCGNSSKQQAEALLSQARSAVEHSDYSEARMLVDSIRQTYPREVDVRRQCLGLSDSIDWMMAQVESSAADSVTTFSEIELKELLSEFVLEKDAKYQTTGNYVLSKYAGDKTNLQFFPQVSEDGIMSLVSMDKARKYVYTEVLVEGDSFTGKLPAECSADDMISVQKTYTLALAFKHRKEAAAAAERAALKVRFYEKKLQGNAR